jgi:hypothetical protein
MLFKLFVYFLSKKTAFRPLLEWLQARVFFAMPLLVPPDPTAPPSSYLRAFETNLISLLFSGNLRARMVQASVALRVS